MERILSGCAVGIRAKRVAQINARVQRFQRNQYDLEDGSHRQDMSVQQQHAVFKDRLDSQSSTFS
jgi:hypothetical protein